MPISPSTLTIDLGKVRDNYNYLKSLSSADIGPIVKANAYGLGVAEVSSALYDEGCRIFFITHLQEGIELRIAMQPKDPAIYVLNGPFFGEEEEFVRNNLTPVLNSLDQSQRWQKYAHKLGRKLPCVIHADSGINRFGMSYDELLLTSQMREFEVLCLMSHLACADIRDHELNSHQLECFKSYQHLLPNAKYSLANSSGIFLGKEFHFDLLRPGIALYGINPTIDKPNPMKNPVTLTSRIIQIRDMKDRGYVGYGATHESAKGAKIATVPLGYADGFLRYLSNRGAFYINGARAPIVGRVSMDLINIDVSNIECSLGSEVEIIGKNVHPDDIATLADTIANEILISFGTRHERIYLDEYKK